MVQRDKDEVISEIYRRSLNTTPPPNLPASQHSFLLFLARGQHNSSTPFPPTMDNAGFSHFDNLLGDPDCEPCLRATTDPEAESVRSHPSVSSHVDQTLLPHPSSTPAAAPSSTPRHQTQRLQRRRNHYYYINGTLTPAPAAASSPLPTSPHVLSAPSPPRAVNPGHPHGRSKSYPASSSFSSGHAPSWLLLGGGGAAAAFADAKRQSWTGERRETRKLQKDHPVGSARPGFTVEIGDGDDDGGAAFSSAAAAAERDGARGSVLGVRRKMERLKGLYRRGDKDVEVTSSNWR